MSIFLLRLTAERPGIDVNTQLLAVEHEPDVATLQAFAKRCGVELNIEIESIPLFGGNGQEEIADWLQSLVDVDPEPVVSRDRTSILIDELVRSQRNQERRIEQLTTLVGQLAGAVSGKSQAAREQSTPQQSVDWNAFDPRKQSEGGVLTPLRMQNPGAHVEHGASSVSEALEENRRAGANRIVPGNMALRGTSAASEMYGPGVDSEGNPGVRLALPKVGDTLKPITNRDD